MAKLATHLVTILYHDVMCFVAVHLMSYVSLISTVLIISDMN